MLIVSSGNPGGIAVCSSRIKKAVDRNRRKRIIRAALHPLVPAIKPGCSVAVFADLEFEKLSLPERTATLRDAFVRARLLEP